jgi:hypothetical protein
MAGRRSGALPFPGGLRAFPVRSARHAVLAASLGADAREGAEHEAGAPRVTSYQKLIGAQGQMQ